MSVLYELYGRPKGNAQITADVWHELIGDADYREAKRAVMEFARNDTRDYATFPAAGVIVKCISDAQKQIKCKACRVWNKLTDVGDGESYEAQPDEIKCMVTREQFDYIRDTPYEHRYRLRERFISNKINSERKELMS